MAKYFIPFAIYFGATTDNLFGQSLSAIQLDRPDQTECPFITPKNIFKLKTDLPLKLLTKTKSRLIILQRYGNMELMKSLN